MPRGKDKDVFEVTNYTHFVKFDIDVQFLFIFKG